MENTFKCHGCGKDSRFTGQATVERMDGFLDLVEEEPRTYPCEFCGTDNRITMTVAEWNAVG